MHFFRQLGQFMLHGARAHARWEIGVSNAVFGSRKRQILLILLMIPVIIGGISLAASPSNALPEFLGGKTSAKLDVCETLKVPPQLLGIEGSQTYANYEQARAAFYEDAAIPLFNNLLASLNRWLGWRVGLKPTDIICVDIDAVSALEPRRAERNKTLDTMPKRYCSTCLAASGF